MHSGHYSCFVGLHTLFTEKLNGFIYLSRENLSINMDNISLCKPIKLCKYILLVDGQHVLFCRIRSAGSSCSLWTWRLLRYLNLNSLWCKLIDLLHSVLGECVNSVINNGRVVEECFECYQYWDCGISYGSIGVFLNQTNYFIFNHLENGDQIIFLKGP